MLPSAVALALVSLRLLLSGCVLFQECRLPRNALEWVLAAFALLGGSAPSLLWQVAGAYTASVPLI